MSACGCKTAAVILAAGSGIRMNLNKTKQRLLICGKSVLRHSLEAYESASSVDSIIIVCRADEIEFAEQESKSLTKVKNIIIGGKTRAESAKLGFYSIFNDVDFVAFHDAARCLITPEMIDRVIGKAHESLAATAALAVSDTVKIVDSDGKITATIPRETVFRAQTPQVFEKTLYARALECCDALDKITDDNMLVERIGTDIYAVDLGPTNIKITAKEDLTLAKNILTERGEGAMSGFRIGHGYDVHKLTENRKLIIGGVEIPYEQGLLGHSDADVLLHAVMDSILGAAALGDIGRHFPDTSDEFRGISSMHLLTRVAELIRKRGFRVVNVDATLVMQKPKVAPYVPKMISNIAFALGIPEDCVNVKATTEEHLGFTGREEGASAHAVVMLSVE